MYIDMFKFKTLHSYSIKTDYLIAVSQDIDRTYARFKLLELLPPDIVLKVETSILEFTLITMTFKKFNINIISNIYNDKLKDIYNNLDPNNKYIQNKTLLDNVINNCMLIIIWPFPSPLPTIGYDYNAIELFKPISIFTLVESFFNQSGAAGSEIFHNEYLINNHLQYNKEHITIATHTEHKNVIYKMILLLNKDYPSIKPINLPTKVEGNPKFHASECIIC